MFIFDKISIFDLNFYFSPNFHFDTKISIFCQNFYFLPKFLFFAKISIFCQISIFDQNYLWSRLPLFPKTSIFNENIKKYPGDPLSDFTVIRFLDRFVYKNPKARETKNSSVNKRRVNRYLDTTQLPVTSLEFLKAKEKDLAPQDKFMQR